ncbi:transposable element Tcb2 transposase [Trichonephila clavipes]|nr:transposable element Tcb2 transposase [Trichonephila clavipes]
MRLGLPLFRVPYDLTTKIFFVIPLSPNLIRKARRVPYTKGEIETRTNCLMFNSIWNLPNAEVEEIPSTTEFLFNNVTINVSVINLLLLTNKTDYFPFIDDHFVAMYIDFHTPTALANPFLNGFVMYPGRIIGKLEEGRSVTSVAAEFGIAHSIVSRLWRQFQTTGTAIWGFSSGRPRGTTPADDRYIVLQARRNRRQTAGEIARYTTQATGRPISRFTVARRLHGGGLFARRPVRCVPLTPAHRRMRSLWCREHGIGETMNGDEYSLQMRADSV